MRRREKEITDRSVIDNMLKEAKVCRIALSDGNMPYILPMNFGYRDGCIYLHSAKEGKKIDILTRNNNICFEVDLFHGVRAKEAVCNWGAIYESVVGFGKAYIIEDPREKKAGLNAIVEKFSDKPAFDYSEKSLEEVAVIKIVINEMTGKKS